MTRKKIATFVSAFTIAAVSSALVATPAQAAKECRGATGVIQCTPDRIACILNGSLPPQNSCF